MQTSLTRILRACQHACVPSLMFRAWTGSSFAEPLVLLQALKLLGGLHPVSETMIDMAVTMIQLGVVKPEWSFGPGKSRRQQHTHLSCSITPCVLLYWVLSQILSLLLYLHRSGRIATCCHFCEQLYMLWLIDICHLHVDAIRMLYPPLCSQTPC